MTNKPVNYKQLSRELDDIVSALQSESLDVDEAMQQYERGLMIVKQLEAYLQTAENKVVALKSKDSE